MACERASFVADAFHQVTVGCDHPSAVADEIFAKLCSEFRFRHGHANSRCEALAKRTSGGLNACRMPDFWVASR